ncbi:MAG: uroporphyrinogen decarboxylase family protein [Anaerolineae bacterium]
MNSREWMYAAIEGRPLEHFPVIAPYVFLSNADHWVPVTGEPVWKFYEWCYAEPSVHAQGYQPFYDAMPFDWFQAWQAPSRADRENISIVFKDGVPFFHDRRTDTLRPVPNTIHEAGSGGGENETRYIYDSADARAMIKVERAETLVSRGVNDYIEAAIPLHRDRFVVTCGIVNTFYSCVYYLGMQNFYCMLLEEPELIHEMSKRILEKNIETIRAGAMAGGDAIYIDDATATNDMVSLRMYEEFALPYLVEEVKEIHRLGLKAVVLYFGGIADRVEQIVSSGLDLLIMETSMKGYVNDYASICRQINGRCCLGGNLNPYDDVEVSSEAELEQAIRAQATAGRLTGKHITSTGSPLTPGTSVARIARFIELGHNA